MEDVETLKELESLRQDLRWWKLDLLKLKNLNVLRYEVDKKIGSLSKNGKP